MSIRTGIIGLGLMGQRMMASLLAHDQFSVTRLHDGDAARAREVSARAPGAVVDPEASALLSADDVDLVYIATPPSSHIPLAREAVTRGKPVFLEKPLAVDLAEARHFVERVEESGVVGAVNFPFATLPGLSRVEQELDEGRAGDLQRLSIALHFSRWPRAWHTAGEWLSGRAEGGFLREVLSHFVYLTHRLAGPLTVVRKNVEYADEGRSETRATADLECGGIPVSLVAGAGGAAPDFCEWTLYGSQRSYRLQDWSLLKVATESRWYDVLPDEAPPRFPGAAQLDALVEKLEGRPSVIPDLRAALEVQEVIEALLA